LVADGSDGDADDRRALERQLLRAIVFVSIYLLAVGAGSIVAVLVLLGPAHSTDLSRVALLALCGGALGGVTRALFAVVDSVERGVWELGDGAIVERSARRAMRAREIFLADRSHRQALDSAEGRHQPSDESSEDADDERETPLEYLSSKERAERAATEADRRELGLTRVEYDKLRRAETDAEKTDGFGVQDVPLLVMLPLLGAALGLIAFAGLVGGFIVASGTKSPTYSPAGLLFIAVLAGMFSPNFIASLARAADAIFGNTRLPSSGGNAP
jgi:hypothetical protein